MNSKFTNLIKGFPEKVHNLQNSEPRRRLKLGDIPQKGIYVFYDAGIPLYTGRTDSMKNRLMMHGRPGSHHNQASFAFLMAKKTFVAADNVIDRALTRKALAEYHDFKPFFDKAKSKVAKMDIRFVEMSDPTKQHLFEVYVSLELETTYNEFKNH